MSKRAYIHAFYFFVLLVKSFMPGLVFCRKKLKNLCYTCYLFILFLHSAQHNFVNLRSRNFAQIRESLRREKLYIDRFAKVYSIFSPNLLAALDNALILVSWLKKSRRQCSTKTRSPIAIENEA